MSEIPEPEAPASPGHARLTLDPECCIGVGQCEMLAPDVFRLDDDEGIAVMIGGPWRPVDEARLLADRCPSGAIQVAEIGCAAGDESDADRPADSGTGKGPPTGSGQPQRP